MTTFQADFTNALIPWHIVLFVFALVLGCTEEKDVETVPIEESYIPTDDEFLVVILPDTQVYAQSFPETFDSQLRWVAEHAEEYNIVFVSHVGDIVQNGDSQNEWDVAIAAFDWLDDINLPHGFSMGAHDFWVYGNEHNNTCSSFGHFDCDFTDFLRSFGPDKFANKAWFKGSSPSGISSYQKVTVGDLEIIFLHLPQDLRRRSGMGR